MDEQIAHFSPRAYRDGTEPDWVVGYEITPDGWKPIDAARDAEMLAEAEAELDRGEWIDHDAVMAELQARFAAPTEATTLPAK